MKAEIKIKHIRLQIDHKKCILIHYNLLKPVENHFHNRIELFQVRLLYPPVFTMSIMNC